MHVIKLLEATASVRKLLDWPFYYVVREFLCILEILLKKGHPLPSVINLFIYKDDVCASITSAEVALLDDVDLERCSVSLCT